MELVIAWQTVYKATKKAATQESSSFYNSYCLATGCCINSNNQF